VSGRVILTGITEGKSVEEILATLPKRIQKRSEEIRNVLETTLSETAIARLRCCLDLIFDLDKQIEIIVQLVHQMVAGQKRLIRILTSVPGIRHLAAVTLIALRSGTSMISPPGMNSPASWAGLVPTVNQSADHLWMGSITRRGSRTLRWVCVEIAHAAVRIRSSRFMRSSPGRSGNSDSPRRSLLWHARSSQSSGTWW